MRATATYVCGVALAVALMACDQGGSRYVDPTAQASRALGGAATGNSPFGSQGVYQGSNSRQTSYSSHECYKQCLVGPNGEVPETCPQHCAEYNIKSMRGMYFDQDLNPTVSFQTAFGASRLGNSIGQPSYRTQLMNQYFQGQAGGYLPYQSQLFQQMYPRGVMCPHGDDCENITIQNPQSLQHMAALDQAAYQYQIGNPKAPETLRYALGQQSASQGSVGGLNTPQFDFSRLEGMFKGFGNSFRNAGMGVVNGVANAGVGVVNGVANAGMGMAYNVGGAGNSTLGNAQFSGLSWQNGSSAQMMNSAMYNMAGNAQYGNNYCNNPNFQYYAYLCVR